MMKLTSLIFLFISCCIVMAAPHASWKELAIKAKYIVFFDVGVEREFAWIPVKEVEILKGDIKNLGDHFLNISKSGKMIVVGIDSEENLFVINEDGFIINKTEEGRLVVISSDEFKKMVINLQN